MSASSLALVFRYADARAAGFSRHQITHRVRTGAWKALRRGVYCLSESWDAAGPRERLILLAAAGRLANPACRLVDSHVSAAARLNLPLPNRQLPTAALTDGDIAHSTRVDPDLVIQVATLWAGDVWRHPDGSFTSPARTAADCLRHYDAEVSIPIADAAIQRGLTSAAALGEVLGRQRDWPYASRAADALPLVDGRRETWLESVSAVRLFRQGVELAEPQVEIYDDRRRFVARVDFLWQSDATVGEADGLAKYSLAAWPDLVAAGPTDLRGARDEAVRRVIREEKAREDALRELGLEVARWSTTDIMRRPDLVAERVMRARRRGDLWRFRGQFKSTHAA